MSFSGIASEDLASVVVLDVLLVIAWYVVSMVVCSSSASQLALMIFSGLHSKVALALLEN